MVRKLIFFLKVSRPGLWFQTLWLYLLPTADGDVLGSAPFWLGLVYCSFPLNFLMYGWNDMVDIETDALNPRKDSFLWGARGEPSQLRNLPLPMALVQLPFWLSFLYWSDWRAVFLLAGVVALNGLYNLPKSGWRGKPPLELINVLGMLLLIPFSVWLNETSQVSHFAYLYLAVFCIQAHLIGEVMDLEPDRKSGRATTALFLGRRATKILIMVLVGFEATLLLMAFSQYLLAAFLYLLIPWLVFDLLVLDRKPYSRGQLTLMGFGLNTSGYASILWVWFQGGLS